MVYWQEPWFRNRTAYPEDCTLYEYKANKVFNQYFSLQEEKHI